MREQAVVADLIARIQCDSLAALERALCERTGAACCVVTGGGRDAMLLALRAAGVAPGGAVVCPSLGDPMLLHTVLYAGARPLFADIHPNTWLMDSFCLEYVLGKRVRTKQTMPAAVIASNLFGLPCDYPALENACARYGIALIEDMRGSMGGRIGGRVSGSFGDYSVLTLPGGNVSAVFCRHGEAGERLRRCAVTLVQPDIVSADLAYEWLLQSTNEEGRRRRIVREYRARLGGAARFQQAGEEIVGACDVIAVALEDERAAGTARESLARRGLGTDVSLPSPLHQMAAILGYEKVILSHTEGLADKLVALPLHAYLNSKTVARIIYCLTG